ncbi:MAG: hypothetical protein KDA86_13460 [Planctomycetaceae bacterium]|nr:hypothetical protein [Planctomycetaceae bacterium]
MSDYRYHVAVENHIAEHHWTEKLADAFLGATLPFYFGCPNASDYFPAESFIPIDIRDFDTAVSTIKDAIDSHQYERRLPVILETRRLVLEEINLFSVLSGEIEKRNDPAATPGQGALLWSRHAIRHEFLRHTLRFAWERINSTRVRRNKSSSRLIDQSYDFHSLHRFRGDC